MPRSHRRDSPAADLGVSLGLKASGLSERSLLQPHLRARNFPVADGTLTQRPTLTLSGSPRVKAGLASTSDLTSMAERKRKGEHLPKQSPYYSTPDPETSNITLRSPGLHASYSTQTDPRPGQRRLFGQSSVEVTDQNKDILSNRYL